VDRCRPTGAHERALFALCHHFVRVLSSATPGTEASLFFAFELAFLDLQGFGPALTACADCGAELRGVARGAKFSPAQGGGLCDSCAAELAPTTYQIVAGEVWQVLRRLREEGKQKLTPFPLPRPTAREVGILLHKFLGFHLPGYRLPAALDLLRPWSGPTGGQGEGRAVAKERFE
jgi:recombinational DNA repair protein (RecF pathway)